MRIVRFLLFATLLFPNLFIAFQAHAQQIVYFGLVNGIAKTGLANKNDKNAGPELDYKSTYHYNGGLELGMQLNKTAKTMLAVRLLYSRVGQKYSGSLPDSGLLTLNADTRLNYIKLPIMLSHTLFSVGNFKLAAGVGFYISRLASYKDKVATSGKGSKTAEANYTEQVTENSKTSYTLHSNTTTFIDNQYSMSYWVYNKDDYGPMLFINVKKEILKNILVGAQLQYEYGLTSVENHGANFVVSTAGQVSAFGYWNSWNEKYIVNRAPVKERPDTHNHALGLFISINYYFP